ncbi:MAG TPA: hypothetical protein VN088_08440 [Nocardioides sp.]|nr:hypothetical protein [Nocardioides sp.]
MHSTPAAAELLSGTHGERIKPPFSVTRKGDDGKYASVPVLQTALAKWLPNLKVPVCASCNGGWMSRLEMRAKALLEPFMLDGAFSQMSTDDQDALAAWATKCWMAYALIRPAQRNPFTQPEYRGIASARPLRRSNIWMFHCEHPASYVSMSIESSLISSGPAPDMEMAQDNTAICVLAVSTVVFVMLLRPEGMHQDAVPLMIPEWLNNGLATPIWPTSSPAYLANRRLPDEVMDDLMTFPREMFEAIGLPTEGLDDEEIARVLDAFLEGTDVTELRDKWKRD